MLNLGYGVLAAVIRRVLVGVGFDLSIGFLHEAQESFDVLVWGFVELFRVRVDGLIRGFVAEGRIRARDFIVELLKGLDDYEMQVQARIVYLGEEPGTSRH